MKNAYYTCNGQNIYMNSFGSSITSVSIAISTLYDNNINPVQIFNYYKEEMEVQTKEIAFPSVHFNSSFCFGGVDYMVQPFR